MIRFPMVWAMARAEMRLSRRLVRYWLFVLLAVGLSAAAFSYHAGLHYLFSTMAASFALINPRFFSGNYGATFTLVYLVGVIFLAFDVRSRDVRERIAEVLDARPITNLELIVGRWLGLLIVSWVPLIVLSLLLLVGGSIIGESPEPLSLLLMAFLGAIPALAFGIAATAFCTLVIRNRLVAAIVLLAAWATIFAGFSGWLPFPLWVLTGLDISGAYAFNFPSDLASVVPPLAGLAQRAGLFLAALGLLGVAAVLHPRRDGVRNGSLIAVAGLAMAIGLAGVLAPAVRARGVIAKVHAFETAHAARATDPAADLQRVSGRVGIDPGRVLSLDLDLQLAAPEGQGIERVLLSLNPGLIPSSVEDSEGLLDFQFENGLLDVTPRSAIEAGAAFSLHLVAAGVPDTDFAYIDGAFHPLDLSAQDGIVFLFGFQNLFFERGFVALPMGVRWLPLPGAEVGRDALARGTDFFSVDLAVELPEGWDLAGPGLAQSGPGGGWRLAPTEPLPGVGLIAGHYLTRSTQIDDRVFRVLLAPERESGVEVLEAAGATIGEWIGERSREADDDGLGLAYGGVTAVEVPNALRGYGGGWRRDTMLAQPGLALLRESGLPTARFDVAFSDPADFSEVEGGLPEAIRSRLVQFVRGDAGGGNPIVNAARGGFSFRTAARGPGAPALNYVTEVLASRVLAEEESYFSTRIFEGGRTGQVLNPAIGEYLRDQRQREQGFAAALARVMVSRNSVWEAAIGTSLLELDPSADPQKAIDVLSLKGSALARTVIDGLGRERCAALLAAVLDRFEGTTYTAEQFLAVAGELDPELERWLRIGLETTELPALRPVSARVYRLEDDEGGTPRYQLLVRLWNDSDAAGLLRLTVDLSGQDGPPRSSDPIRIDGRSGREIGVVVSRPPSAARVEPYVSLNREPFALALAEEDLEKIRDDEPFHGDRAWDGPLEPEDGVLVDDLDDGASFEQPEGGGWLRRAGGAEDEDLDHGLPSVRQARRGKRWLRWITEGATGRYRHTAAIVRRAGSAHRAVASASLPAGGTWQLEWHVPSLPLRKVEPVWTLTVTDAGGERTHEWKPNLEETGWQPVESFDLQQGEVDVSLALAATDESGLLFFDALRWRQVAPAGEAP